MPYAPAPRHRKRTLTLIKSRRRSSAASKETPSKIARSYKRYFAVPRPHEPPETPPRVADLFQLQFKANKLVR
ncbi:MAG: hypothetical protein CR217_18145 [Beijerinckiaceae bacterium]|nr:MAG: hypothetical protein CR217_18145 [Beijerinckiaceae bacterium]